MTNKKALRTMGLGASVTLVTLLLIQGLSRDKWWIFFSEPEINDPSRRFGDLKIVATWIDCWREIPVFQAFGSTAQATCEIDYPLTSVLTLNFLGLSIQTATAWGFALVLLWGLAVALLLIYAWLRLSSVIGVCVLLVAISPASSLLLERGNLDIVMWLLTLVALSLIAVDRLALSSVFITAGIAIKFYSIGLLAAWLLPSKYSVRLKVLIAIPPVALAALLAFLTLGSTVPRQEPMGSAFGILTLPYGFRLLLSGKASLEMMSRITSHESISMFDRIIAPFTFICSVALAYFLIKGVRFCPPVVGQIRWFTGSASVFLLIYLLGQNFDYRYVFTIPVIIGLGIIRGSQSNTAARHLLAGVAVALASVSWLSVTAPRPAEILGDVILWALMSLLGALLVRLSWPNSIPAINGGGERHRRDCCMSS